tara:strand:- start:243 stop:518 length:276 start_codon:yes stop_codon:yes gene_type:complete
MEETKKMPGYTGYKPQHLTEEASKNLRDNRFYIPGKSKYFLKLIILCLGYSGYVPSIKAENVFGESYGKTTGASVNGSIPQGFIQSNEEKY